MLKIKRLLNVFVYVIAGNTCGAAIYTTLFYRGETLSFMLLWQIIGLAAVCTLGNLFFLSNKEISGNALKVRFFIHYVYINIVVVGWAVLWEWIEPVSLLGILVLILIIAGIYSFITFYSITNDKKVAMELNKRLRKIHREED